MNNSDKIDIIEERIKEYNFKISDFNNKILEAEKSGSEYASKLEGYRLLLNDYISIRDSLQDTINNMQ